MADDLLPGPVKVPGYYDFTAEEYHADPAPRPSGNTSVFAELLTKTPRHAKEAHPRLASPPEVDEEGEDVAAEDNKKFDLGSVAHELLLGKGQGIEVLDFKNWQTKASKEARKEAIENGLQPVLKKVYHQAEQMVAACLEQLGDDPENRDAFTAPGRSEVPIFWQEEVFRDTEKPRKMWMRGMLDRQWNQHNVVYDYKTFSAGADPDKFLRWLINNGKDIQDPFYSRGVAAIEGCSMDEIRFRFVLQDTEFPYLVSVIELDQAAREWANDRAQWAIDKWAELAAKGTYRGYVPRTHYIGIPSWAQLQWEDRRQQDTLAERMLEEEGQ